MAFEKKQGEAGLGAAGAPAARSDRRDGRAAAGAEGRTVAGPTQGDSMCMSATWWRMCATQAEPPLLAAMLVEL